VQLPAPSLLALALAGLLLVGCRDGGAEPVRLAIDDDAITVASFDFAESEIVAEIYAQALEDAGFRVVRDLRLGPRELVFPALARGLVELVPEYAGTAATFIGRRDLAPSTDAGSAQDALTRVLDGTAMMALAPSPAQDANAFVVTRATAALHNLRTLDDLAAVAPGLAFGGPPECPSRPLCLAGLERTYGVRFGLVFGLDVGGRLTRLALEEGHIDVGLLFSTDPALGGRGELVELLDDRQLQPAENLTPLVRREVVQRWGSELTAVLDEASAALSTEELRELRGQVELGDVSAREAARYWWTQQGVR
jgi:osmoprotectant transport system substrate-binding protein